MSIDKKSTHYDKGGIECISVIKAKMSTEKYQGFLLGNIIKYALRLEFKNPDNRLRDAEKASCYAQQLVISLREQNEND